MWVSWVGARTGWASVTWYSLSCGIPGGRGVALLGGRCCICVGRGVALLGQGGGLLHLCESGVGARDLVLALLRRLAR